MRRGRACLSIVVVALLVVPLSSATFFDWIVETFNLITGRAAEGEGTPPLREQVTCTFLDSASTQECFTDDGRFRCSGANACATDVSGASGESLRWKSSCGDEASTTIDGNGQEVVFRCAQEPLRLTAVPEQPAEGVTEQVRCAFLDSDATQKCRASTGGFACSGAGGCAAEVYGARGTRLEWRSSCSGQPAYTTIDGDSETAEFRCAASACGNGACESGETCSSCPADCGQCATREVKEQVKCAFLNSNAYQKCHTSDGRFACSGAAGCVADVHGAEGTRLEWRSSCGGYTVYTVMDGSSENVEFKCAQEQTPIAPGPEPACAKDQPWACRTEIDCRSNAGYWCDGKCSGHPCPTCSKDQPWACRTDADCKNAGGYWCRGPGTPVGEPSGGYCQQSQCPTYTCGPKEPWNCRTDTDCGRAGLRWCKYPWGEAKCEFSCPEVIKPACGGAVPPYKSCRPGEESVPTFDGNGCPTGSYCRPKEECAADWNPVCGANDMTYSNACRANAAGVGIKYYGECGSRAVCNDNAVAEKAMKCQMENAVPEKYVRSDGCTDVFCRRIAVAPQMAPSPAPPAECVEEKDPATGFIRFKCRAEQAPVCPPLPEEERMRMKDKCYAHGGTPEYRKTLTGCEYLDCNFERKETVFEGPKACPTDEQRDSVENKCRSLGLKTVYEVVFLTVKGGEPENACRIAKCIEPPKSQGCPTALPPDAKAACPQDAFETVGVDERGCNVMKCVSKEEKECPPIPPKEAFLKCEERGGKLVVKQDERGCVRFLECVSGREEEIYVEKVNNVPDTGELLELALRLEEMTVSLDQFGKKIDRIAEYHKSSNSPSEYEKFQRVKALLATAREELGKAKENLRDRLDTLTTDDIEVFKYRIKEVKQILKKILFVLLGGEEAREEITASLDCGENSACMERSLKSCKPAKITQGGSVSEIVGLEDGKCVVRVTAGPESMTCRIDDYALGTKNLGPTEQYCEGALVSRLAQAPKPLARGPSAPVLNSVVTAKRASPDPNDIRYLFTARDPEGIREFHLVKPDFGEVDVKVEPSCVRELTTELKFDPSNLPHRAYIDDCGTPVTRQELKVDIGIPAVEAPIRVQQAQAASGGGGGGGEGQT